MACSAPYREAMRLAYREDCSPRSVEPIRFFTVCREDHKSKSPLGFVPSVLKSKSLYCYGIRCSSLSGLICFYFCFVVFFVALSMCVMDHLVPPTLTYSSLKWSMF